MTNINNINDNEFLFYQSHDKNFTNPEISMLKHTIEGEQVSSLFFSQENIKRIQKLIKYEVYRQSNCNFKLDVDQDESDLLIVMRSVYLEYGKFLPDKIIHQVKKLNRLTVDTVLPDMLTGIKQGYSYLKEINEPLKPIPHPINVNLGKVNLPSISSVLY